MGFWVLEQINKEICDVSHIQESSQVETVHQTCPSDPFILTTLLKIKIYGEYTVGP